MSDSIDGPTDLYRYFDADDRLLYVGISFSAVARASQHRAEKGWWTEFVRMEVERFATRAEAAHAEREAIKTERPIHNVTHNTVSANKLTKRMIEPASERFKAKVKQGIVDLVGLWNLSPPDDGDFPRVEYQTKTVADLGDNYYLVQFYSWWDGRPTNTQIFHLSDMRRWKSYETHEAWLAAGEIGMQANDLWAEGRLSA